MVVSSQRCALAGTGEGVLIHTAHGLPGLTFKLNPKQKLITAIFMIMWTCHLGWWEEGNGQWATNSGWGKICTWDAKRTRLGVIWFQPYQLCVWNTWIFLPLFSLFDISLKGKIFRKEAGRPDFLSNVTASFCFSESAVYPISGLRISYRGLSSKYILNPLIAWKLLAFNIRSEMFMRALSHLWRQSNLWQNCVSLE